MPGTVEGGKLAAKRNKQRHGPDFYARIGALGGKKGHTGGFAANRDLARKAGRLGGLISRRTKAVVSQPIVVDESKVKETTQNDLDLAA